MGVVNVTPDSFSDGGLCLSPKDAIAKIKNLIDSSVDYIDIGAESTKPGSLPISVNEEWQRLCPVFDMLKSLDLKKTQISLDSRNSNTIEKACSLGLIHMINDVSGTQKVDTLNKCLEHADKKGISLKYCAMHMFEEPRTMQLRPLKRQDAIRSCEYFFERETQKLENCGFHPDKIFLDPGIGFGKDDCANLSLIQKSMDWSKKYNLLYGVSRKSFIGRLLDIKHPEERDPPTKMVEICLAMMGVKIIRTHDTKGLMKIRNAQQLNSKDIH